MIPQEYIQQLNELRANHALLKTYDIEMKGKEIIKTNQTQREQLLMALLVDHRTSDYAIAEFLYEAENTLRKTPDYHQYDGYEVDTLYLAALVLSQFGNVEDLWRFMQTKEIDMDAGIGFDSEFLLSFGIEKVFSYLETTTHPLKEKVLCFIGISTEDCDYDQEEIDNWRAAKRAYFL